MSRISCCAAADTDCHFLYHQAMRQSATVRVLLFLLSDGTGSSQKGCSLPANNPYLEDVQHAVLVFLGLRTWQDSLSTCEPSGAMRLSTRMYKLGSSADQRAGPASPCCIMSQEPCTAHTLYASAQAWRRCQQQPRDCQAPEQDVACHGTLSSASSPEHMPA